jgi:hypothetical protein
MRPHSTKYRRQPVKPGKAAGVSVREITATLAWVSTKEYGCYASGRRAIGRAVRLCRRIQAQAQA